MYVGRAQHGVLKAATALRRKQVIQQLLVGDLADLADEGLYHLLPVVSPKPRTTGKWKTTRKSQRAHTPGVNTQRWQQNSLPGGRGGGSNAYVPTAGKKGTQGGHYAGTYGMSEAAALCYGALEEKAARQLRAVHSEAQLAQLLKKTVLPELNLRSYLACRSELDLDTVRLLIRGRPRDEANELDHSLTMATLGHRKKPPVPYRGPTPASTKKPLRNSQSSVLKNPYSNAYKHNRIHPFEWED